MSQEHMIQVCHASDQFPAYLDELSRQGWELVTCSPGLFQTAPSLISRPGAGPAPGYHCVFRRPVMEEAAVTSRTP